MTRTDSSQAQHTPPHWESGFTPVVLFILGQAMTGLLAEEAGEVYLLVSQECHLVIKELPSSNEGHRSFKV